MSRPPPSVGTRRAARVTLLYLAFGAAWIVVTDRLVRALTPNPEAILWLETWKGWFYVALTAVGLYVLLRRREAEDALRRARDELEARVRERTAELEALNRALRAEIDERLQAEEALQESEESYRTLFESIPEAIYIQDREGRFLNVNPAALALYGYQAEEILGQTPAMLADPERVDVAATLEHVRRAFQGEPQRFEWWGRRKNGDSFPKEVILSRAKYFGQDVVIAAARDITDRKRAEEALRASERRYRELFEETPFALCQTTPDGTILDCNTSMAELLGYPDPATLRGRSALDLYADPADRDRWRAEADRLGSIRDRELRMRRADGRVINVQLSARAHRDDDSRALWYEAAVKDITEQRQLEEQLRHAQKLEAVGQFAGGIAHDFNNLLTAVRGYTDLVLEGMADDDPRRDDVREIAAAADRATALTRRLLAFGRRQVLQPEVLDLNQVVADIEKMLRRVIGENIAIVCRLAPEAATVEADPSQLEQVIMNLAVNARDAMPRGGRLTLETADVEVDEDYARAHAGVEPGRYVLLSVSDTGHGMDRETLAHIFEPFFTTKEKGKGTGLGLSTVYGIVEQSGGHIWVYSEPGQGTTFKIYLPRADESAGAEPPRRTAAVPPATAAGGTETVLLVEDDPPVRSLARRVLAGRGYAVLEAGTGEAALQIEREFPGRIDLLVTDTVLPGISGPELARRLTRRRPGLRVVATSGYAASQVMHDGRLAADIVFLEKPFSPQALLRTVREVLGAARTEGS